MSTWNDGNQSLLVIYRLLVRYLGTIQEEASLTLKRHAGVLGQSLGL
ncbi:MAG: hypothetical protein ACI8VR_003205, partial [Candidatus Azotimanducaceae bacterium]